MKIIKEFFSSSKKIPMKQKIVNKKMYNYKRQY